MVFISPQNLFSFSRYSSFCLDFLVMHRKGLVKKIKVNFKFYDVIVWSTNSWNTHIAQYFHSISYIRISTKKNRHSIFERNSCRNACFKFLCNTKLITSLLVFLICSKTLIAFYLSFRWFNDSWTRAFELVTYEFELLTRGFELVTCGFGILTFGFEIALLNFSSYFYIINSCF